MRRDQSEHANKMADLQGHLKERTQQLSIALESMNSMVEEMKVMKRK